MTLKLPNCDFCKYYHATEDREWCDAFPDGIPMEAMMKADIGVECAEGYSYEPEEDDTDDRGPKKDGILSKMLDIIGYD